MHERCMKEYNNVVWCKKLGFFALDVVTLFGSSSLPFLISIPRRSASLNNASSPMLPLLTASLSVPSSPHHTPPYKVHK